jgi:hypothetical protein
VRPLSPRISHNKTAWSCTRAAIDATLRDEQRADL